jgi:hypothetical protein
MIEFSPELRAELATIGNIIDGAKLLAALEAFIGRFMILPSEEAQDLIALWVLHTHAIEAAWATPYLRIVSAAPASGKSQLLEILAALSRRGWYAVNPSVAVLYRKIDAQQPTLLLDEMDNYPLDDRRDALAVLNAGYKRGARIDRCREKGDLQSFSAYCPKAYAGLDTGPLPDTLLSRSITIRPERRLASEEVEMWIGQRTEPEAVPLRERCEAWAEQNVHGLASMKPELPEGMHSRPAEVWWALLNIADRIGGDWPERVRTAWRVLSTGGDATDEIPERTRLLLDIRQVLGLRRSIGTHELLNSLNQCFPESPWGAMNRNEGMADRQLATRLRPFKVKPKKVRVDGQPKPVRGYHAEDLGAAFDRYLQETEQAEHGEHSASDVELDVPNVPDVPSAAVGA